jgi:hypothetical protein
MTNVGDVSLAFIKRVAQGQRRQALRQLSSHEVAAQRACYPSACLLRSRNGQTRRTLRRCLHHSGNRPAELRSTGAPAPRSRTAAECGAPGAISPGAVVLEMRPLSLQPHRAMASGTSRPIWESLTWTQITTVFAPNPARRLAFHLLRDANFGLECNSGTAPDDGI